MGCAQAKHDRTGEERCELTTLGQLAQKRSNDRSYYIALEGLQCKPQEVNSALNLFFKNHMQVPELCIRDLPHLNAKLPTTRSLQVICLEGVGLSDIPVSVANAENLTRLSLSRNKIEKVPDWMSHLSKLEDLDLSHNQLTVIGSVPFGRFERLRHFTATDNVIAEVTLRITKLRRLEHIDLSFNKLTTLPEDCFHAESNSKLQILLNNNPLRQLPNSIGLVASLSALDLSETQLEELPASIETLRHLETLALPLATLKRPPPEVVKQGLPSIRRFLRKQYRKRVHSWAEFQSDSPETVAALSINSFSFAETAGPCTYDLYSALEACRHLEELQLCECGLTEQPLYLPQRLKKLNLSRNNITRVERNIQFARGLTVLNLSINCIDRLDLELAKNTKLKVLDLSANKLEEIHSESFAKLRQLTDLDLSSNQLCSVRFTLDSQTKLERLNLSNNWIDALPNSLFEHCASLSILLLSYNSFKALPSSMEQLHSLRIFENFRSSKDPRDPPEDLEALIEWKEQLRKAAETEQKKKLEKEKRREAQSMITGDMLKAVTIIARNSDGRVFSLSPSNGQQDSKQTVPTEGEVQGSPENRQVSLRVLLDSQRAKKRRLPSFTLSPAIESAFKQLGVIESQQLMHISFRSLCYEESNPSKVLRALTSYKSFLETFASEMAPSRGNYSALFSRSSSYGRNVFEYKAFGYLLQDIGFTVTPHGAKQFKVTLKYSTNASDLQHCSQIRTRIRKQLGRLDIVLKTLNRLELEENLRSTLLT